MVKYSAEHTSGLPVSGMDHAARAHPTLLAEADRRHLSRMNRATRGAVACLMMLLAISLTTSLGGCMLTDQLGSAATHTPAADASPQHMYLETMNALGNGDPARQADVFHEAKSDFTHAPTTTNTLRYALACITPGHPATRPDEGKRLLETLLATPENMTQEERTLAAVLLNETNARLQLEAENRRLAATLDGQSRSQANSDKRVQAHIDENNRLRRALAEAQQKLDAIKEIERSIIERSSTPPGNRDATAHPDEAQSSSISR